MEKNMHDIFCPTLPWKRGVGATNPGSVAQTVHRRGNKITTPKLRPKHKRPVLRRTKVQHKGTKISQRSRISPREKSLPCRVGAPSNDGLTPGSKPPGRPDRACQDSRRQNHLTTTDVVDWCSVKLQSD